MVELDRYAGYVIVAFAITWLVLGGYLVYLRSRLTALSRELERLHSVSRPREGSR